MEVVERSGHTKRQITKRLQSPKEFSVSDIPRSFFSPEFKLVLIRAHLKINAELHKNNSIMDKNNKRYFEQNVPHKSTAHQLSNESNQISLFNEGDALILWSYLTYGPYILTKKEIIN